MLFHLAAIYPSGLTMYALLFSTLRSFEALDNKSIKTTDIPSGIISSNFLDVSLLKHKIVKPSPNRSV